MSARPSTGTCTAPSPATCHMHSHPTLFGDYRAAGAGHTPVGEYTCSTQWRLGEGAIAHTTSCCARACVVQWSIW
jgi:hypothetical protein